MKDWFERIWKWVYIKPEMDRRRAEIIEKYSQVLVTGDKEKLAHALARMLVLRLGVREAEKFFERICEEELQSSAEVTGMAEDPFIDFPDLTDILTKIRGNLIERRGLGEKLTQQVIDVIIAMERFDGEKLRSWRKRHEHEIQSWRKTITYLMEKGIGGLSELEAALEKAENWENTVHQDRYSAMVRRGDDYLNRLRAIKNILSEEFLVSPSGKHVTCDSKEVYDRLRDVMEEIK